MNLIDAYLEYRYETEPPIIFHRWSITTSIAALLGRRFYLPFGSDNIYPNLYVMLIGGVGVRKSTAIKQASKIIGLAGYKTFAHRKTSKEKFLSDLEGKTYEEGQEEQQGSLFINPDDKMTQLNLFGGEGNDLLDTTPKEVFITADEFNEFTTGDKLDFYSMLGDLWDWDRVDIPYTYRTKNSRSIAIYQPTISILGGNTPENFNRAFPPDVLGQGFMSRLLIILGEPSGRKYHMPKAPKPDDTEVIIDGLKLILDTEYGEALRPDHIWKEGGLVYKIYQEWRSMIDPRFRGYNQRRYTQFLKLCLVHAASLGKQVLDEEVVILTNTVLAAAERNMVKALGEFGKNKDSDVINIVLNTIRDASKPVNPKDLWKLVHKDLKGPSELNTILQNLQSAELIQHIRGAGYLPIALKFQSEDYIDWGLLHEEERNMI